MSPRPTTRTAVEIEYPESDGQPMGETQLHIDWMFRLYDIMRHRYRGQRVFVASDLLLYYVEGVPQRYVVPDVFIVKDCEPLPRRRTFLVWEEDRVPTVVFEVTSRATRRRDESSKPEIYAEIGVAEFFLYDPTADYLSPPLQGHRLTDGGYVRIEADASGRLLSQELDAYLQLDEDELLLIDRPSGLPLLTRYEAAEAERQLAESERQLAEAGRQQAESERQQAEAERRQAEAERDRERAAREAAEAEVARLRKLLSDAQDPSEPRSANG